MRMDARCGTMVEGNIKLDQAKFIDMDSLSRDSAFDIVAQVVRKAFNSFTIG